MTLQQTKFSLPLSSRRMLSGLTSLQKTKHAVSYCNNTCHQVMINIVTEQYVTLRCAVVWLKLKQTEVEK